MLQSLLFGGGVAMKKVLALVSVVAMLVATLAPAYADGWRRHWRGHRYGVGVISRNVITPYYYPYYGSHYSYVAPDPVPPPTYVRYVFAPASCWWGVLGYWVC